MSSSDPFTKDCVVLIIQDKEIAFQELGVFESTLRLCKIVIL